MNEIDCIIENQGNEATVEEESHDDVLCRSVPTNSVILRITGIHSVLLSSAISNFHTYIF